MAPSRGIPSYWRLLVALLPLVMVCTDGQELVEPRGVDLQISLAPRFTPGLVMDATGSLEVARISAYRLDTEELLGSTRHDLDPEADSWTFLVQVPVPPDLNTHFFLTVELLHVDGVEERVEWSGRTLPLPLQTGVIPQIRETDLIRGPLTNLSVTSVAILGHAPALEELEALQLAADATTSDPQNPPVTFWSSLDPALASVTGEGLVMGLAPGTARIAATAGAVADTTALTVTPRPATVALDPGTAVIEALGEEVTLAARVLGSGGEEIPREAVGWEVENPDILADLGQGAFRALAPGTTVVVATSVRIPQATGSAMVVVDPRAAQIEIEPGGLYLEEIGETGQLQANAWDSNGNPFTGGSVMWHSLDPAVVTVDASGQVSGVGRGVGRVVATQDSQSDTVRVTVGVPLSSVVLEPGSALLRQAGKVLRLTATALDETGQAVPSVINFLWSSSDESVAVVDGEGVVTAVEDGTATISASVAGAAGSALVTVSREVESLVVTPSSAEVRALGGTIQFTAEALDAGGTPVTVHPAWSSSNPAVAEVDGEGLVTARTNGEAIITARVGALEAVGSVTVNQAPGELSVSPDSPELAFIGHELVLTAHVKDGNGRPVESGAVAWKTSDPAVLALEPHPEAVGEVAGASGLRGESVTVRAVGPGIALVTATATAGGVKLSETVEVQVILVLDHIQLTPVAHTFRSLGETRSFEAAGYDEKGTLIPGVNEFTWESSDPGVAEVDAEGTVTAVGPGSATITASAGEVQGRATVQVEQVVTAIEVTPSTVGLTFLGETRQLTATALDSGGNPVSTTLRWSSDDPSVAEVDGEGRVQAAGEGTTMVTASVGGVSASAEVTVQQGVATILLDPDGFTFAAKGETQNFTATALDAGGAPVASATDFTWSSGNRGVVAVGELSGTTAQGTAVDDGETIIRAEIRGVEGTADVAVVRHVAAVTINPGSPPPLTEIGGSARLSASVADASGFPLSAPVRWESSDESVVSVDTEGFVTAVAEGTVQVTASSGGMSDQVSVTVLQAVRYVTVTPRSVTFSSLGSTRTFSAMAYDGGGTPVGRATSFTWSSSDTGVASVSSPSGATTVVTAVGEGGAEVRALAEGVQGTASVTVSQSALSITIRPSQPAVLSSIGSTLALSATVRDIAGQPLPATVSWASSDPSVATVDSRGVVTALANGSATITASSQGVSDRVTVTVRQAVSYVAVTPASVAFSSSGDTRQLSASAFDAGGTPVAWATSFSWSSSDDGVAMVDGAGMVTAVGDGTATVSATAGGVAGQATVVVSQAVDRVEVTPSSHTFSSAGETQLFTAMAYDAGGREIGSVTSFNWSSGDRSVLSLSSTTGGSTTGTAVADGTTSVSASVGGVTGSASVTVARSVADVTISPSSPAPITEIGGSVALSAAVTDALGQFLGTAVTWSSADPGVATVSGSGLVTAVANGTAVVTATSGGVSGLVTITVEQSVDHVTVTPGSVAFASSGETRQLTAVAYDAGGTQVAPVPSFVWTSSDPAVATVSGAGLVSAESTGAATVTATAGGASGNAFVTVNQAVARVEVTPASTTFTSRGETRTFTASAYDAGDRLITGQDNFTWSSGDRSVVTVGATTGASTVGTARDDGSTTIAAAIGGVTGTASVTVARSVANVTLTPDNPGTLTEIGGTVQLSASVTDALGQPLGTGVTWSSSDSGVATVDGTGLVTAVADGAATISATSGGVADQVTVTVAQGVSYITVTPSSVAFTSSGEAGQLAAVAYDAGGTEVSSIGTFTWASSNEAAATVDGTGLVTAIADGTASVTASAGGVSGSSSVTVGIAVASVVVSPASRTFASRGETETFSASALDALGQPIPSVTSFNWSSGNRGIVTVNPTSGGSTTGTAVADGTASVTAAVGGVTGSATVTVARVVADVTISPVSPSTLTSIGGTVQLSAAVNDALGESMGSAVSWSSSANGVATVSGSGLVTAVANGTATVTATSGGVSDQVTITVEQAVDQVTVTPASVAFASSGETSQLAAAAYDAGGTLVTPVPTLTWVSSDPGVATVSGAGLVTAVSEGSAAVSATAGGATGSAVISVTQSVATVEVTPSARDFTSRGETQTFTAVAYDAAGQAISSVTSFRWTTGAAGVVSVSPTTGTSTVGTAVADGVTTVSATADGVSGSADVSVAREVAGVAITPNSPPTLTAIGETAQLTASASDALGEAMEAVVSWSSSDEGVVGIAAGAAAAPGPQRADASAIATLTAVANGTATITATSGGVSAQVTVGVEQAVDHVTVTPSSVTFTSSGQTQQFAAVAEDAGGTEVASVAGFNWATSDAGVVTVDGGGLATAVADGPATVSATAGGVTGTASVTVDRSVGSVAITSPAPGTLTFLGETVQLSATTLDANGEPMSATVTWSSLSPTVAMVDAATGVVSAASNGTAQIVAQAGDQADTVTVTVQQTIATVVVSPDQLALSPNGTDVQLSAQALDAGGSEVAGVAFTWLSIDPAVASVDPNTGLVTPGTIGTTAVEASSQGVTGTASVTVSDQDQTRTWTGGSSGDLLDPANWEPAGLPSPTDSLVITATGGATPTLTGDFEIGTLVVEEGATLDIGTFNLTVNGDLEIAGEISGDGTVEMTGTDASVSGTLPNLLVSGTATASGDMTVNGVFTVDGSGSSFDVGSGTVQVTGDLETDNGGVLSMSDPNADLDVDGDLLLGGGDTEGSLSDGVLHLAGELVTVSVSFKTFNPDGNHTVILDGTTEQSVYLQFPGTRTHRFQNLIIDNPAGVVFQTDVPILGFATILQGTLSSRPPAPETETTVWAHGDITDAVGGRWRISNTVIMGTAPSLPASLTTHLTFEEATALQNGFDLTGDLMVTGSSANLDLNGQAVTVRGDFVVETSARLTMTDPAGDLTVTGLAEFGGGSTFGILTAGRIQAGGDFSWVGTDETSFAPTGTHQVVFNGSGAQQILINAGGSRTYTFQEVRVAAGADVTLTEDATVLGDLLVEGTLHLPVDKTLTVQGTLTVAPGGTLDNNGTVIGG